MRRQRDIRQLFTWKFFFYDARDAAPSTAGSAARHAILSLLVDPGLFQPGRDVGSQSRLSVPGNR